MWKNFVALLCTCVLAVTAKSCTISLPEDLKGFAPVILTKASAKSKAYDIFKPTGKVNNFAEGSRLHLVCTGSKNSIESLGVSSLDLQCTGGQFVDSNSNAVVLKSLVCKAMPGSKLKLTQTKCSKNRGVIYEAGIEVYNKFYRIFEICYDKASETTFYTHNTLHGAVINYNIPESARRPFEATGMKFNTRTVNTFYTQNNQKQIFEKLFGADQTYIDKKNYLSRGHLSPDADFMFGYEQFATYYYVNVAPQYQPVNGGNWLKVEDMSRSLAGAYGNDIESYNGYLGIVEFPRSSRAMVKVYLDPHQQFHIPKYYFKVLWQKSSDAAIVFVSVNNPFTPNGKADEFCKNVCDNANLNNSVFTDVTKGHTFCCTLDDFKKTYDGLPVEVKAKNLLMFKDNQLRRG